MADLRPLVRAELTTPPPPGSVANRRQIDVDMPHYGEHEHDELAANPKCAFQPARHPNARERTSIQHVAHFRRAMPHNFQSLHSALWSLHWPLHL